MGQSTPSPHSAEALADGSELTLRDARVLRERGVPFPRALALARRRRPRSFNVAYAEELSRALPDASAFSVGRFMACGAAATPTAPLPVVQRTAPRARGAGRPAGRRAVSSRAGPSDDPPGSDEPPGELTGRRSAQTLRGPSPRFSRPWRPDLERRFAGRLRALVRPS